MDVIVDTNIVASDFAMRKNRFANLLDYLRRADSALVICKVVWDEALAEYTTRLKGDIDRVTAAWEKLNESRFTYGQSLDLPVRAQELQAFENNLKAPAKGVKVIIHGDYSGVDINEVVRRGVHRVRPASDTGEELRDVILWLHAIDYAKQKASAVAFISHDDAFIREEDSSAVGKAKNKRDRRLDEEQEDTEKQYQLHPDLQKDLRDAGVDIKFYRFLSTFNRMSALRSSPATKEWLKALGTPDSIKANVRQQISTLLVQRQGYMEHIKEVSISALDFMEGTVHEVDEKTQFAELRFRAEIGLVVESFSLQGPGFQWPVVQTNFSQPGISKPSLYNEFIYEPLLPGVGVNALAARLYTTTGQAIRQTTLRAQVTVSARIQGERVSGLEIDKFAFESSNDPLLGYPVYTNSIFTEG